jgi:hypothetical protein
MKKGNNNSIIICISLGFLFFAFTIMIGCAPESPKPKEFDSTVQGPQLIVEPDVVRLGVAKLLGTEIIFRGKGLGPEEKVMIVLSGVEDGNRNVSVPFCFGKTDKDGNFTAEVDKREKIINILQADINFGKKGASVVISMPPIPTGKYSAEVMGYKSNKKAACEIVLVKPTFVDRLKDWLAGLLGKIEHEEGIQSD